MEQTYTEVHSASPPKSAPEGRFVSPCPVPKPDINAFQDYGEYLEAIVDWKIAEGHRRNANTRQLESVKKERKSSRLFEWGLFLGWLLMMYNAPLIGLIVTWAVAALGYYVSYSLGWVAGFMLRGLGLPLPSHDEGGQ